jgi:hypothetical protein
VTLCQVFAVAFVIVAAWHELGASARRRADKYADVQPPGVR